MNRDSYDELVRDDVVADRPPWMSDELVQKAIRHFRTKTSERFGEPEAVEALLSLGQLFEATGLLKLEIEGEADKEVHGVGEGEQS